MGLEGIKVLIADDLESTLVLLSFMFEQEGAQISLARNGNVAIDMAEHEDYDIILMDIQMPECNGIEATKKIRDLSIATPIIAVTAASEYEAESFPKMGFSDFFQKPIDFRALKEKILQHIIK